MKKRILPALLALVMVLSLMPMTVFAADAVNLAQWSTDGNSVYDVTTAEDGTVTYKLKQDISTAVTFYVGGSKLAPTALNQGDNVVLDLNGHTLAFTGNAFLRAEQNTQLKITDTSTGAQKGKITSANRTVYIWAGVKLTIDSGVEIETTSTTDNADFCITAYTDDKNSPNVTGTSINLSNVKLTAQGEASCMFISGNFKTEAVAPQVTMSNVTMTNDADVAVCLNGIAKTEITNSSITSNNVGIEIRAGELDVAGTTITGGTGVSNAASTPVGGGTTTSNAGIAVANYRASDKIVLNINDNNNITGSTALYVKDSDNVGSGADAKIAEITVNGANTTLKSNADDDDALNAIGCDAAQTTVTIKAGKIDGAVTGTTGTADIKVEGGSFTQPLDADTNTGIDLGDNKFAGVKDGVYTYYETSKEAIDAVGAENVYTADDAADLTEEEPTVTPITLYPVAAYASPAGGGTIVSDVTQAAVGDTVTFTVTPASGYSVSKVTKAGSADPISATVDGTTSKTYEVTMTAAPLTVIAEFNAAVTPTPTPADFTVTPAYNPNGIMEYVVTISTTSESNDYLVFLGADALDENATMFVLAGKNASTTFQCMGGMYIQVWTASTGTFDSMTVTEFNQLADPVTASTPAL